MGQLKGVAELLQSYNRFARLSFPISAICDLEFTQITLGFSHFCQINVLALLRNLAALSDVWKSSPSGESDRLGIFQRRTLRLCPRVCFRKKTSASDSPGVKLFPNKSVRLFHNLCHSFIFLL